MILDDVVEDNLTHGYYYLELHQVSSKSDEKQNSFINSLFNR